MKATKRSQIALRGRANDHQQQRFSGGVQLRNAKKKDHRAVVDRRLVLPPNAGAAPAKTYGPWNEGMRGVRERNPKDRESGRYLKLTLLKVLIEFGPVGALV
ncbi:MAG TPA: hypothetical protein VMR90_00060 [Candidatus Cybelea sp.]|nr:hypothetical protein [Candidatus Cybelea sp.]